MKSIILLGVLLLLCASQLSAQVLRDILINKAEYFLNDDPGPGKARPIDIGLGFTVPVLVPGIAVQKDDRIYVRVRNEHGVWSAPRSVLFKGLAPQRVQAISSGEYFINRDPGVDNASAIQAAYPNNPISLNPERLAIANADDVFYLRLRNSGGHISAPRGLRLGDNPIQAARALRIRRPQPNVILYDTIPMNLTFSKLKGLIRGASGKIDPELKLASGDSLCIQMQGVNGIWGPCYTFVYQSVMSVEPKGESGVLLYPNPVQDVLTLRLPGRPGPTIECRLFNSLGRQVARFRKSGYAGTDNPLLRLETSHLPAGCYLMRISSASYSRNVRFVKLNS